MSRDTRPINPITEGAIWKQLLLFFYPILLGTFFQQLYNTADAIIVGHFVGKEALAAVGGATSVLINFLVNLFMGVSSGATVVISQYYGARDLDNVERAVHTAVALALAAGAAFSVVGLAFSRTALLAMGTPGDILGYALTYLRIYFFGTIASFLYNIGSGVLRAVGDTKRPLYFLIVACLVNIALDLLFVVKLRMGVMGVATATVISQVVSAVLVLMALCKKGSVYQLDPRRIRFYPGILGAILRIGFPAGLQSDMYVLSNIFIQSCINSFGTNVVAAWTAFGKIDGFYWMVSAAYGLSITTFVGQNFGAQKYDRIRKSVRVCLWMLLGSTVVICSFFCAFARPLLGLFTEDAEVLRWGSLMMFHMVPFYFTYVLIEILSGAIRGAGEALRPMFLVGSGVCALRVLWVFFVLPLDRRLETLLVSYPVSWVITSALFALYYLRFGWLRRQIALRGFTPLGTPPAPEE